MKTLVIRSVRVPTTVAPSGNLSVVSFIRELVLSRPAWRERGKAALLLEIDGALENVNEGDEVKWSDEAHELLCEQASMRDIQLRWDLAATVARFQEMLYAADSTKAA